MQSRCASASSSGSPENSGLKLDQFKCTNCCACGACGASGACGAAGPAGGTGGGGVVGLEHLALDQPFLPCVLLTLSLDLSFNLYIVLFCSSYVT